MQKATMHPVRDGHWRTSTNQRKARFDESVILHFYFRNFKTTKEKDQI
jgi:hypothetical protein